MFGYFNQISEDFAINYPGISSIQNFSQFLNGPSNNLPQSLTAGGFIEGDKISADINSQLAEWTGDINESVSGIQDTIMDVASNIDSWSGGYLQTANFVSSLISYPETSFNPIEITPNPKLIDLINSLQSAVNPNAPFQPEETLTLAERFPESAESATSKQPNPRNNAGLGLINTPYRNLGDNLYSQNLITKHPIKDDDKDKPKTVGEFYPSSLGTTDPKFQGGDVKTLAPVLAGETLSDAASKGKDIDQKLYRDWGEASKYGLPFYFKDLRDNKYIIFRGYLEDINQDIQPEWAEHTYLGRSEPAYVYSKTRRGLNFSFKVFANTKAELELIYEKLNYLQSLTYPRYHQDNAARMRMMPPLASLRIGDLFGNNNRNLGGFIESLSYNWSGDSPWEVESGKRVPKQCLINVAYKVIHREPPSVDTALTEFLGLNYNVKSFDVS